MKSRLFIILLFLAILIAMPIVFANPIIYFDNNGSYVTTEKLNFIESFLLGADSSQLISSSSSAYTTYGASGWISKPTVDKSVVNFGDTLKIIGYFRAVKEGDYYLEGGIEYWTTLSDNTPQTQLIVPITKNLCDSQDVHFVNEKVHLTAGDHRIEFTVKPNGPGERTPRPATGWYVFQVAWLKDCTSGIVYDFKISPSNDATGYLVKVNPLTTTTGTTTATTSGTTTTTSGLNGRWIDQSTLPIYDPSRISHKFKVGKSLGATSTIYTNILDVLPLIISDNESIYLEGIFEADVEGDYYLEGAAEKVAGAGALESLSCNLGGGNCALQLVINSNACDINPAPGARYAYINQLIHLKKGRTTIRINQVFPGADEPGPGVYATSLAWIKNGACSGSPQIGSIITLNPKGTIPKEGVFITPISESIKAILPAGQVCEDYTTKSCLAWKGCGLSGNNCVTGGFLPTVPGTIGPGPTTTLPPGNGTAPTPLCERLKKDECEAAEETCVFEERAFALDKCVPITCDASISFNLLTEGVSTTLDGKSTDQTSFKDLCLGTEYVFRFSKQGYRTYTVKPRFTQEDKHIPKFPIQLYSTDVSCAIISPDVDQNLFRTVSADKLECSRHEGCYTVKVKKDFDTGAIKSGIISGAIAKVSATSAGLFIAKSAATKVGAASAAASLATGYALPLAAAALGYEAYAALSPDEKFICVDSLDGGGSGFSIDKTFKSFTTFFGKYGGIIFIGLVILISLALILRIMRFITGK